MNDETKIKKITMLKNGDLEVILQAPAQDFISDKLLEYDDKNYLKKEISNLIANKIMELQGKKIIKEVLENVNWPDVVRSEVAQKVIKEIATGYKQY